MHRHVADYNWKKGKPYGCEEVDPRNNSCSYKIVADPYFKRISIEKYHFERFEKVIYDSCLLDFRQLSLTDQMAWEREILKEDEDQTICLLRDQNDRAVLIETLLFEDKLCRSCITSSIHGIQIAKHCMYYRSLSDPFDGVILYDMEGKPVMRKEYEWDEETGEFTDLLREEWSFIPSSGKGFLC